MVVSMGVQVPWACIHGMGRSMEDHPLPFSRARELAHDTPAHRPSSKAQVHLIAKGTGECSPVVREERKGEGFGGQHLSQKACGVRQNVDAINLDKVNNNSIQRWGSKV